MRRLFGGEEEQCLLNKQVGIEGDANVKERSVCKGFRPDDPGQPINALGGCACSQAIFQGGAWGQKLAGGKADAMVAEVHGPGIVFAKTADLVAAGYFGKAEEVAIGNPDGAAAVDRRRGPPLTAVGSTGQSLEMAAGGMEPGEAVGMDMLLHRQEKPVLDQCAVAALHIPVGTGPLLAVAGGFRPGSSFQYTIIALHGVCLAISTPVSRFAS